MGHPKDLSEVDQDILFCLEYDLLNDPLGQAISRNYRLGILDDKTTAMIHQRVAKEHYRQAFSGTPFRNPRLEVGEIILGFDLENRPLPLPLQYFNAHSLTVANSGAGKTTKAKFLIVQIGRFVKGLWVCDMRKQEFRDLCGLFAKMGMELNVLQARNFRYNPAQVPFGVEINDWIPRVSDLLVQVFDLPQRASKLLQTTLFKLYHQFGVFGGSEQYPTLFDLAEALKNDKEANPQAKFAILDSLEPVLLSLGPEVLAYRYGWRTHDLAKLRLILEFSGIGEREKNLRLNSLLLSEFTSRVAQGISNTKMDLWICCDEAQRLCSRISSGETSAIADQIGLVRGPGIGLDLNVLSTTNLTPQIPSNTSTKILGRSGNISDYVEAGHSMGLRNEEIQWAQFHLRPGMFICQLGEGNWRYPFVFTIPPIQIPREQETQTHNSKPPQSLLALPTVRAW